MRLVTFAIPSAVGEIRRVGAIRTDGAIVDLTSARELLLSSRGVEAPWVAAQLDCPATMLAFIGAGQPALAAAAEAIEFVSDQEIGHMSVFDNDAVHLLAPLPKPASIRCFSLSEKHMLAGIASMQDVAQWGGTKPSLTALPPEWYNLPTYYKTSTAEIYGPDDLVPWPALTERFDYELEVAVVIGRRGRQVPMEEATDYIYGYTLYNDWSARDFQNREMSVNLGPGLCKDNAASLGPCIVTRDELKLEDSSFTVMVNGEVCAQTSVEFHFPLEKLVEYVSEVQTIFPGDVFTSGTLPGGSGAEKKFWISEGSTIEFTADGIGTLRNKVGFRGEAAPLPAAQRPWVSVTRTIDI
jgi:2-keto-4-pentenoate hydratase/2-oxohepta-3-ene-1,7-dioic acid hydratase in catechol pathway